MKEDNWKQFVTESLNLDPWDPVYKVCRSKTTLLNRCQRMVLYAYLNVCRTVSTESMLGANFDGCTTLGPRMREAWCDVYVEEWLKRE